MERNLDGEGQGLRLLSIWSLLLHGNSFKKKELAQRFGVSEKSIQRDISLVNAFLLEQGEKNTICYDYSGHCYQWERSSDLLLSEEEIIVLATVLLESRALPKKDLRVVLRKLLTQSREQDRDKIQTLINNEMHNYKELQNCRSLGRMILQLSEAKQQQLIVELDYKKIGADTGRKIRVEPLGIMFAEFYFYLLAKIEGKSDVITFRLDRILHYFVTEENFKVDYQERFQEGIFRKEIQMMNTGNLAKVKFKFWGLSLEAVLDKLPNAKILQQDGDVTTLEAKVYLRGAKMWFLSQAEFLEILEPEDFRQEMAATIQKMLGNYKMK